MDKAATEALMRTPGNAREMLERTPGWTSRLDVSNLPTKEELISIIKEKYPDMEWVGNSHPQGQPWYRMQRWATWTEVLDRAKGHADVATAMIKDRPLIDDKFRVIWCVGPTEPGRHEYLVSFNVWCKVTQNSQ